MIVNLCPVRSDDALKISVVNDAITINGHSFDFTPLMEGETLPAGSISSEWIVGDVTRTKGEVVLTVRFPHGAQAGEAARFPKPIVVTKVGPVILPDAGHKEKK